MLLTYFCLKTCAFSILQNPADQAHIASLEKEIAKLRQQLFKCKVSKPKAAVRPAQRAVATWHGKCCDIDGSLSVMDNCEQACKSNTQLAGVMRLQSELLNRHVSLYDEYAINQVKDVMDRWLALGFELTYDAEDKAAQLNRNKKPFYVDKCCDEVGLFTEPKGCKTKCTSQAQLGKIIAIQSEFVSHA